MDNEYEQQMYDRQSASPWELKESQLAVELTEQQQIVRCPACTDLSTILSTIREEEGMSIFNDCSFLSSVEYSQSIELNNYIIQKYPE